MKRYSHTLFFVAFATFGLLTSGLAQAQQPSKPQRADTLRRELTVVSDAEVHLGTVQPLASTYQFDKPKVTRLEPIPPRSTGDFTPPVLLPEYPALSNMASWVPRSNKAGYLDLSLGLEPVVRAQAGYTQCFKGKHVVDLHLRHNSTFNNNSRIYQGIPARLYTYRHLTDWDLSYEYRGKKSAHSLQIIGDYDQFNYYGLDAQTAAYLTSNRPPMEVKQDYEAAIYRYVHPGNVGRANLFGLDNQTSFRFLVEHTGRNYSQLPAFFSKWKHHELRFIGDFDLLFTSKQDFAWGLAGMLLYQDWQRTPKDPKQQTIYVPGGPLPSLYFNITPKIYFNGWLGNTEWQVTAGVNVLPLSPVFRGSLRWRNNLEVFARVDGKVNMPSLHELARENRYLHPDSLLRPEVKFVDSELGIRAQLPGGVSLSLSGGYERTRNTHFWQPFLFGERADNNTPRFLAFTPQYARSQSWFVSGRIGYALGAKLQSSLQWTERRYKLDGGGIAQGKPIRSIDFSLIYSPTSNLDISAQASLREGIPFISPHDATKILTTAQRVARVATAWRITDWLALHGELSAPFLLSSEYPLGYQDPNYIVGIVGATLRF